jgi:hypothetical protein
MASSTLTISDSIELRIFIFCFFDIPMTDPHPKDTVAPVDPPFTDVEVLSPDEDMRVHGVLDITYEPLELLPVIFIPVTNSRSREGHCRLDILPRASVSEHQLQHIVVKGDPFSFTEGIALGFQHHT